MKKLTAAILATMLLLFGSMSYAQGNHEIMMIGAVCDHKISITLTLSGEAYVDNPKKSCVVSFSAATTKTKECTCIPKEFIGSIDGLELTDDQIKYLFSDEIDPIEIIQEIDLSQLFAWGYILRVDKTGVDKLD